MSLIELPDIIQGTDIARFRRFVHEIPGQCWEWQSTKNRSGYGKFWLNARTDLAHRVAYRIHLGPIAAGLVVRHACDNKSCVNPDHLLLGTVKDNARDAVERGRYRRGSDNGRAKLTASEVDEIRRGWADGETQVSLARRFGVSRSAVQFILSGRTWVALGGAS